MNIRHTSGSRKRRLAAGLSALGLALAGVLAGGTPAAAAADPYCANAYAGLVVHPNNIIARLCIDWDGAPSGSAYTTTQVRIWNPTGNAIGTIWSIARYNDGQSPDYTGAIADGNTYIRTETHVGTATTKFELTSTNLYYTYCAYMIPGSIEVYQEPCR